MTHACMQSRHSAAAGGERAILSRKRAILSRRSRQWRRLRPDVPDLDPELCADALQPGEGLPGMLI